MATMALRGLKGRQIKGIYSSNDKTVSDWVMGDLPCNCRSERNLMFYGVLFSTRLGVGT
jgi:hypothetical protein